MVYSLKQLNFIIQQLDARHCEEGLARRGNLDFVSIVGPTCTGKTDLALALAEKLSIPIINADSRLIFLEMDIGTAKPTNKELEKIKHYLVNIKKPNETYSAGDYRKDFDECFAEIKKNSSEKNGPYAVVVGGTGLYLQSALENLEMPSVNRDDELRKELSELELPELLVIMNDLDPEAQNAVDTKNKIRIIRAIEILKSTGKALSEARSKNTENRYNVMSFGMNFSSREIHNELINKRVLVMLEKGLVKEVEELINKYGITRTMLATIGYKEIISYLQKECSLEEACAEIQQRTRAYAKRQMTWFKRNQDIIWLNADEILIPS